MKRKITFLLSALFALTLITQPVQVMGQERGTYTKTEGFETSASNNDYQSTFTVNEEDSDCGIGWTIYYGCVSTSSAISNTNSAALRLYKTGGFGYLQTTTPVYGLTNVACKAKAATSNSALIKIDILYSENGSSWTAIAEEQSVATSATSYNWDIPSGGKYFKIAISSKSTRPTKSGTQLTIDDIVFTYTGYTVTYDANGGTGEMTDEDSPYGVGAPVTVLDNEFTAPANTSFNGWVVTDASSNVLTVTEGQFTMPSSNVTVTAQWLAAGNYINVAPSTNNVSCSEGTANFTLTTNIASPSYAVQFYTTSECNETTTKPGWLGNPTFGEGTLSMSVSENTGAARTAYFKVYSGTTYSSVVTINQAAITVLPPTFNHGTGTYYENQSITLTNQTDGASIYYTMGADPADPTSSSTPFTEAISVTATTKIKAIAIKNGVNSSVTTAEYTIIHPKTIAEARTQATGSITTRGIVTYISGKYAYIQDASEAALCLYKSSANWNASTTELTIGDDVVASGSLSTWNGLLEINGPTLTKLSSGNVKPCVTKTIAQINSDNFSAFQGLFVQIVKATYNSDDNEVSQGSDVVSVSGTMGEAEDEDVVTFKGNITYSSEIIIRNLQDVTVIKDPAIISDESLSVPNYVLNTPEESVDYDILTVNGTNLKGNITVTLEKEGSSDFELLVSENPDTWGYTMQLTPTTGTVSDALIAVRLKAGKTVADYSDRIVLSSTDATTVYVTVSGSVTYANVTYSGNAEGVTNVPTDATNYTYNQQVTVLGKGDMARTGYDFAWWNTKADGSGTLYEPENKFNITANTTLYAIWEVQTYNYELNVTGDDDDAVAELEVDGNPVAANAKIAYGKEVTVNVVVTDGYIYSISVNNGAVTVTNDKFTMPAGDVTVTVTTEANPYIKAKLLSADILNMTTDTQNDYGYGTIKTKEITSNDTLYVWQTNGYQHTNNNVVDLGMIQLRVRTNVTKGVGYIKLPDFAGKIENIKFDVSGNGNSDTSPTSSKTSTKLYFQEAPTSDGTIIAEGGGSATNTITIPLADKCYSTGYIVANGGLRVWNIVVTYRPYQEMTGTELTTVATDKTISIPDGTAATATTLTIPASSGIIIKSGASLTVSGTLSVGEGGTANNIVIEDGGQLVYYDNGAKDAVQATVQKDIIGYGEGISDKWNFIASPITTSISPAAVTNLLGEQIDDDPVTYNYDLYRLNNTTWENYHQHNENADPFMLVNGQGYLYAKKANTTLSFAGTIKPYDDNYEISVSKGWNLVGNPYTFDAYASVPYYAMDEDGTGITAYDPTSVNTPVKPCTGIVIYADNDNPDPVAFSDQGSETSVNHGNLQMVLAHNVASRGNNAETIDNAIVSFNEGTKLQKFYFGEPAANIFIPQNGEDYAIAFSNRQGDMPLNFKAKELGTYTISFEGEEMDLNGIYLIDMIAEEEIDLSVNPSYTFIGSPADRSARFKIVFRNGNGDSTSDIFAYQSGSDIVVSGEGELQIFDVMGRMVARHNVNGVQTINAMAHGVYIFKLNEKTQKIIVK